MSHGWTPCSSSGYWPSTLSVSHFECVITQTCTCTCTCVDMKDCFYCSTEPFLFPPSIHPFIPGFSFSPSHPPSLPPSLLPPPPSSLLPDPNAMFQASLSCSRLLLQVPQSSVLEMLQVGQTLMAVATLMYAPAPLEEVRVVEAAVSPMPYCSV